MEINGINPRVEEFISRAGKWRGEFERLRMIALECGLTEELKWGVPCYTFRGKNILLIHGFRDYCAILFVKGALLRDARHILIRQTENVRSGRQVRFTGASQVTGMEPVLKAYIFEAIGVEQAGLKVDLKKDPGQRVPEEFQARLDEIPALKAAFERLTPGRQRAYLLYFSGPKQSKTRQSRVEKSIPQILEGKGLNDRDGI